MEAQSLLPWQITSLLIHFVRAAPDAALETEETGSSGSRGGGGRPNQVAKRGADGGPGMGRHDSRWDALLGINPTAWWASLKRTPQLLRQRAFRTRTLAEAMEVGFGCRQQASSSFQQCQCIWHESTPISSCSHDL